MKFKNILVQSICCSSLFLAGCETETGRVVYPDSCPVMSNLTLSANEQMEAADSLFLSVNIKDEQTPLSTLEVTLTSEEETIYTQSIRTKGNEAQIKDFGIYIPFETGLQDREVTLTATAINVEGATQTESRNIKILRPSIPETIYLHYAENVIPMKRQQDNPYEYTTEEGEYPMSFTGKISTGESLSDSKFIWGYSETENNAALVAETGAGFSFNYPDWAVEKITFNTLTFKVEAIGTYQILTVNGTNLETMGNYYQASIQFEQGSTVEVTGIENLAEAYNRDFFSYNPDNQTLTFLRETGTWEIYYSTKYNYMWMARMDAQAPDAFWLVGHGFTSAPVWNDDYSTGGWGTDDISRMGYAVKIGENKYQASIYLTTAHEWESFELEIYSDLEGSKDKGIVLQEGSLQGASEGFAISQSNGITNATGFVPGYYCLTFDTSMGVGKETLYIERLGN